MRMVVQYRDLNVLGKKWKARKNGLRWAEIKSTTGASRTCCNQYCLCVFVIRARHKLDGPLTCRE